MIEKKVFSYIEENKMISNGDTVVVGVSGGADSVCLLFTLLEFRKHRDFSMVVVHVNHGIRKESYLDEEYVAQLCSQHELPFVSERINIPQLARQQGLSEEEAGREARYHAFERAAGRYKANKIAVAHNSNDKSETVLFNLFRGSSIRGLAGIRPVRDNIIRPILCLTRKEIEEYLNEREIGYCKDATNDTDDYTRNRIRHNILPYAEKNISQGLVVNICRAADSLMETEDFLESYTNQCIDRCLVDGKINVELFNREHTAIKKRILYHVLSEVAGSKKDITAAHILSILDLFSEEKNKSVDLGYGISAYREYSYVKIKKRNQLRDAGGFEYVLAEKLEQSGIHAFYEETGAIKIDIVDFDGDMTAILQNKYTKCFDCDRISKSLVIRSRKRGDRIQLSGGSGVLITKSVKDYMINEKIPARMRETIPLLCDGDEIMWIVGYRISEKYKVDTNTKRIIIVQMEENKCRSTM